MSVYVAVVLVGLSAVVLDPSAPQAMAITGPSWVPVPSAVPSSVAKILRLGGAPSGPPSEFINGIPREEWYVDQSNRTAVMASKTRFPDTWASINDAMKSTDPVYDQRPGSGGVYSPGAVKSSKVPAAIGKTLSKAGNAFAVVGVADLGLTIGNGVAQVVGLPTSGDFFCDATVVVTGDTACATGAAPDYQPNSDVAAIVPGWENGGIIEVPMQSRAFDGKPDVTSKAVVQVQVTKAPAYHTSPVGEVRVSTTVLSWPMPAAGNWNETPDVGAWRVIAEVANPQVLKNSGSSSGIGPYRGTPGSPGAAAVTTTFAAESNARMAFDHVEIGRGSNWSTSGPLDKWYPPGHPLRPVDVEDDPERWWSTEWTCSDGGTGTRNSDRFRESAGPWPTFPAAQCASEAAQVVQMKISQHTIGVDPEVIYEWQAPQEVRDWAAGGGADGSKILELHRVDVSPRLSCFNNPEACTTWFQDPEKETNYECSYGGSVVDLRECTMYATTFDRQQVEAGSPYADPETGAGTKPSTPGAPGTAPVPAPDEACPPPLQWNSIVSPWWYYKIGQCVLEWAFVPKTLASRTDELVATVQTRQPVPEIRSIALWLEGPDAKSRCLDIGVDFPEPIGHLAFMDTCDESEPVVGWLKSNRALLSVAVWVSMLAPIGWWAWRTYAPASTGTA